MGGLKALEFYSGIGGLHCALERSNFDATVIRAFDWDPTACKVYDANYGKDIVVKTDINRLDPSTLADLNADLWLLSPACQPYTILNPNALGTLDPRAKSFVHLVTTVIPELYKRRATPIFLLVENVAGFETSTTRELLVDTLRDNGYDTVEFLLTPLQFGIPNSRLRYYLLAKATPLTFRLPAENRRGILRHIPGDGRPWTDDRKNANAEAIEGFLDAEMSSDEFDSLKIPDRVLEKWGRLFDIVKPSSRRTCCFTRGYTQMVERTGSILQMDERLETAQVFDQFMASQSRSIEDSVDKFSGRPVDILRPLRLRYFSPSELLRIFYFTRPPSSSITSKQNRTFVWPADVTRKTRYKLIGNSVNVEVVRRLLNFLMDEA